MEKSIKGTRTEKNLAISFAGESQARMRYTYFASVAKKEGYEQISAIFTETADQEKEHAKRMFKWLEGGMVEITASYPAGVIGTTLENLKAAAAGENEEWSLDYPRFAWITHVLLTSQTKKVSLQSQKCIAKSLLQKRDTKKDTELSLRTSKKAKYSRKMLKLYGSAATAVMYT